MFGVVCEALARGEKSCPLPLPPTTQRDNLTANPINNPAHTHTSLQNPIGGREGLGGDQIDFRFDFFGLD